MMSPRLASLAMSCTPLDDGVKLPSFEEAMKCMEGKRDALVLSLNEM